MDHVLEKPDIVDLVECVTGSNSNWFFLEDSEESVLDNLSFIYKNPHQEFASRF